MSEIRRPLRIAVLGAGPIGIEAALYGAALGHDVVLIEQGSVGQAVAMWGHVTLFSPWHMNVTSLGARLLSSIGLAVPSLERCPTGAEFLSEYLLPLSRCRLLHGRVRPNTRVVAVGREGILKGDEIAQPARAAHRFRMLIDDATGEHLEFADVILDCTGTYLSPQPIGDGGIAAPGERWLAARLIRHLPDVLSRDRKRFARRRTLLIGGGMSAATAAAALYRLCSEEKGTHVTWAVRKKKSPPYELSLDDPLPERARLLDAANRVAVANSPSSGIRFLAGTVVDALAAEGHQMRVRLRQLGKDGVEGAFIEELFDEVIGLTGYGPERTLYEMLQIHECYASFGPMKLAATLLGKGGDCLAQPSPGLETLKNPEPGYFILGAKSYGRNSAFLLRLGHAQVRGAFALLQNQEELDLYKQAQNGPLK